MLRICHVYCVMKKVIYIANIRLPTEKAHGLQIMKTCEALAEKGVEVELFVPNRLNKLVSDPYEFYGVKKNFKIFRLWCWDLISKNFFGRLGFWLESFAFIISVRTFLKKFDEDVIFFTRDLLVANWFSRINSSIFYEIHSLPNKPSRMHFKTWNRCRGLIVISNGIKKDLISLKIPENKILVSSDAVEVEKFRIKESMFECRSKLSLPKDKKIILYTGHLYAWKGANVLAEAAGFLSPGIQVYLVGGTDRDIAVFKDKYKFSSLFIVGWRPHGEMPYWLRAADVLVLPTSGKYKIGFKYTSPLKLYEYLAADKPIIASDLASTREILNKNQATLIEPDNPNLLAETIVSMLQNMKNRVIVAEEKKFVCVKNWSERASEIIDFMQKI